MRMMGAFLRERKREVWLGVVLIGTFACVSYLYRVRMDAVTYALMLSAVFCLLFGVPDFLRFVRKHRELVEVESGFLSLKMKKPEESRKLTFLSFGVSAKCFAGDWIRGRLL